MKLTLDHNVVIDFVVGSPRVARLRDALSAESHQVHIVEIGASEMRRRGIRPDRYDPFEQLLAHAGLGNLPRLAPMAIYDVTFYDHAILCGDEMQTQAKQIEEILFGDSQPIDITNQLEASPKLTGWLNRTL